MNYKIDYGIAFKNNIFLDFDNGFRVLIYDPTYGFRKREHLFEGSEANHFGVTGEVYRYCYDHYDTIVKEVKRFLVREML